MHRPFKQLLALAFCALAMSDASAFGLFTVGNDASCTFNTLQQAIDAATDPEGNSIFIARDGTYSSQHVLVNGRNINFLGGLETCDGTVYGAPIPITGTSGHSVFEIEGNSHVYMSLLDISSADLNGSQRGGGVFFGGSGSLELSGCDIHDNRAGYGGGIDMSPTATSTLTLLSTSIRLNTASGQGGGIRLEGPATLIADASNFITTNAATGVDDVGYGGGIELVGPAAAYVTASVNNNTAIYGGGIAALAAGGSPVSVYLYNQGALYANSATSNGGGIYLKSSNASAVATLCADNFAIDNNQAASGAALFADNDGGQGATVLMNYGCIPETAPIPPVACATGNLCNEIAENMATAADGSVILLQSNGSMVVNRVAMRRNQAQNLLVFVADQSPINGVGDYLQMHESLLVDNTMTGNLIAGSGGAAGTGMVVDTTTIANNHFSDLYYVIAAQTNFLEVTDSIIDQPSQPSLAFFGDSGNLTTRYVLTNDTIPFSGGTGIVDGVPTYVDAANGDYHQARTSLGVDFAPALNGSDLDANPRTVDLDDVPNLFGPADVGAYEIQTQLPPSACAVADTIFCNGFDGT